MRQARRYLGLNLAGAKNHKTALAALEHYPQEGEGTGKIFLLDLFDKIGVSGSHPETVETSLSCDRSLLELIRNLGPEVSKLGVDVPLTLPPCISCTRKSCPLPEECTVPSVKWMRELTRRAIRSKRGSRKLAELTPYTQRPFELHARLNLMPGFAEYARFEVDEALGGTKGPLTARMHLLKRHLGSVELVEVWPKLSVAALSAELKIPKRTLQTYRSLEFGAQSREAILEAIADRANVFIYERDLRKLSLSLASFDAFICAYTALLSDSKGCSKIPGGFPAASGWVQVPST